MTLKDIENLKNKSNAKVNLAVANFREKSISQGWNMTRLHPRSEDEVKALNYIARTTFRKAIETGAIVYDKERRVMIIHPLEKTELELWIAEAIQENSNISNKNQNQEET